MSEPDADYFSAWYADMGEVPDKDRLWTRLLGLPPEEAVKISRGS